MLSRPCLVAVLHLAILCHASAFLPTGFHTSVKRDLPLSVSKRSTLCTMHAEADPVSLPTRRDALAAIVSSSVLAGLARPLTAHAERSFTTMTTAVRSYGPRIKAGINFFEVDLKSSIDKEDWGAVTEAVSEKGKAYRLAYVEKYSSGVVKEVVELKGIMKIFASSITASDSEGPTTQKLYSYLTKYAEFCGKIKEAAAAGDKAAAIKAWKGGSFALRLFMQTLNANIPRSVGKVDLPPPPADATVEMPAPKPAAEGDA